MVSLTEGSSTIIGWKRLSRAESFSICFLYSSIVVAPIIWTSPLDKAGFKILAAFIPPSASPADIMLCISSITSIIFPNSLTSFIILRILDSNWPLNWVPATIPVMSSMYISLFNSFAGTSWFTILIANPSAIAVLPTPASPIRQGLFFWRLFNIWTILSISFVLPIILSIFPSAAFLFKFVPNISRNFFLSSFFGSFNLVFLDASCFEDKTLSWKLLGNAISSIFNDCKNCPIWLLILPSSSSDIPDSLIRWSIGDIPDLFAHGMQ